MKHRFARAARPENAEAGYCSLGVGAGGVGLNLAGGLKAQAARLLEAFGSEGFIFAAADALAVQIRHFSATGGILAAASLFKILHRHHRIGSGSAAIEISLPGLAAT